MMYIHLFLCILLYTLSNVRFFSEKYLTIYPQNIQKIGFIVRIHIKKNLTLKDGPCSIVIWYRYNYPLLYSLSVLLSGSPPEPLKLVKNTKKLLYHNSIYYWVIYYLLLVNNPVFLLVLSGNYPCVRHDSIHFLKCNLEAY